jgi:hypothetical protein
VAILFHIDFVIVYNLNNNMTVKSRHEDCFNTRVMLPIFWAMCLFYGAFVRFVVGVV